MSAMKVFLPSLASVLFTQAAFAQVLLVCQPSEIKEWPFNARVTIEQSDDGYAMTVTSHYYGYIFKNTELVSLVSTHDTDLFTGETMQLTVSNSASESKRPAYVETTKDPRQKVICTSPKR
jgi:hypothetical protein